MKFLSSTKLFFTWCLKKRQVLISHLCSFKSLLLKIYGPKLIMKSIQCLIMIIIITFIVGTKVNDDIKELEQLQNA